MQITDVKVQGSIAELREKGLFGGYVDNDLPQRRKINWCEKLVRKGEVQ